MSEPTTGELLGEVVETAIAELGEAAETRSGNAVEYRRGSTLFAALEPAAVELRLQPDIAEAVLRTPETAPSRRGSEWVRFAPTEIDQFVIDRLEAWLTAAWRTAQN